MHFKDFTEEFYQYPHQISYTRLLRNHHASCEAFTKTVESAKNLQNISNSKSSKNLFNGKVLKNIFTQLKNKTSTELGEFLDLNAIKVATETPVKKTGLCEQKYEVYTSKTANGDKLISNKIVEPHVDKGVRKVQIREVTKMNFNKPEVAIRPSSECVNNPVKFLICPKDNPRSKLNIHSESLSSTLIKNNKEEGPLTEIYNNIIKVISSFKWKTKKPNKDPEPLRTTNYGVHVTNNPTTNFNKNSNDSKNNPNTCNCDSKQDKCDKCGNSLIPKSHACNCWSTEEETLFCLLKIEARDNYMRVKQIEHELKVQKKALRQLNSRCLSLEKNVKKKPEKNKELSNGDKSGKREFKDSSDTTENKIVYTRKNMGSDNKHSENTDTSTTTYTSTNNVTSNLNIPEATKSKTIKNSEEISETATNESSTSQYSDKNPNFILQTKPNNISNYLSDEEPSSQLSNVNKIEISEVSNSDPKNSSRLENAKSKTTGGNQPNLNIEDCFAKNIRSSKVKITISRSAVLITASNGEGDNNLPILIERNLCQETKQLSIVQAIDKESEEIPCNCINALVNACSCPPKKSRYIVKLFRKTKLDEQHKISTNNSNTNKLRNKNGVIEVQK